MKLIEFNPQSYNLEAVLLNSLSRSKIAVKVLASNRWQEQVYDTLIKALFVRKHKRYGVIMRTAHFPEAGNILELLILVVGRE